MTNTLLFRTEAANAHALRAHAMPTPDLLAALNAEDAQVAASVAAALPQIAPLVDTIVQKFRAGGHLFYIGAGTSGRLGVLDASECPPSFGVSENMVQAIMAGGDTALRAAAEGAEDDAQAGTAAVKHLQGTDILIGISASGSARYVQGAVMAAKSRGIYTAALCTAADAPLLTMADAAILAETGAEFVAGSTRMKSGTAQKMILNMISTAVMIRLGKVYAGRMIDVKISNDKLRQRAVKMVEVLSGCTAGEAEMTVAQIARDTVTPVKPALIMVLEKIPYAQAMNRLEEMGGRIDTLMAKHGRDKALGCG